jgi:hypothetical protein
MADFNYELSQFEKDRGKAKMQERVNQNVYREHSLGGGATLTWDVDGEPYIFIVKDSLFWYGIPECYHLVDYGPLGEQLSIAAEKIVTEASDADGCIFESDQTTVEGGVIFYGLKTHEPVW